NYYLILRPNYGWAAIQVYESSYANNNMAVPIAISSADLVATALNAPAAGSPGQSISVSWTVRNQGDGPAYPNWYDDIILSTTATGTGTELGSSSTSHTTLVAAGDSYTVTKTVTLPGAASGNYYLILRPNYGWAAIQVYESSYANNNRAVPIAISSADLVATALNAPAAGSPGQSISVSWTVRNQGDGPAYPNWYDDILLSTTATGTGTELGSS